MSAGIEVKEFKHIPGKNDAEYIKLLEEHSENWKRIATDAVAKIKKLSAQLKEQPEIIHCKDCRFWKKYKYFNGKPTYAPFCGFNSIFTDDNDFCSRAERRGETDGQTD